jgi:hypothetical protein
MRTCAQGVSTPVLMYLSTYRLLPVLERAASWWVPQDYCKTQCNGWEHEFDNACVDNVSVHVWCIHIQIAVASWCS